jgi:hypothetical protein
MIITTNTFTLTNTFAVPSAIQAPLLALVIAAWIGLVVIVTVQHRRMKLALA